MKVMWLVGWLTVAVIQVSLGNIIGNSGFEEPTGTWENDTTNWACYNGSMGQSPWQHYEGSYSLIMANWSSGDYSGTSSFAEEKPAVDAGTTYTIDFYTYFDSGFVDNGATAYLKVFWDTSSNPYDFGSAAETYTLDLGSEATWKLQSFTITSGADAQNAKLEFGFTATGTGGSCYIDNVSMTAVPEPVSATLLGLGIVCVYALRKKIVR